MGKNRRDCQPISDLTGVTKCLTCLHVNARVATRSNRHVRIPFSSQYVYPSHLPARAPFFVDTFTRHLHVHLPTCSRVHSRRLLDSRRGAAANCTSATAFRDLSIVVRSDFEFASPRKPPKHTALLQFSSSTLSASLDIWRLDNVVSKIFHIQISRPMQRYSLQGFVNCIDSLAPDFLI